MTSLKIIKTEENIDSAFLRITKKSSKIMNDIHYFDLTKHESSHAFRIGYAEIGNIIKLKDLRFNLKALLIIGVFISVFLYLISTSFLTS